MKKILMTCLSLPLALVLFPCGARAEQNASMIVDLASDHIDVTVGFSGSEIQIFGDRRDKNTDVVIVAEGPQRSVTVWKKDKIAGTWINRYYVEFKKIPMYYNYALSSSDVIKKNLKLGFDSRIGVESLFTPETTGKSGYIGTTDSFKTFLIAERQKSGVFPVEAGKIIFLNDHFFRTNFSIPPSVPTGEYKIHSYLIKNGKIIHTDNKTLKVEQVGLNAFVLKSAKERALTYSIFCIVLAAASGWFASILRVRV